MSRLCSYELDNRCWALCRHLLANSFLLLSVDISGLQMMYSFSLRHRLHLLLAGEYGLPLSIIFHAIVYSVPLSFSDQMWWLRVVAFLWRLLLKLLLCALYRVLNVLLVSPMYVSLLLLSCLVTVAWYIIPGVRHCPFSGHGLFLRQLHFVVVVFAGFSFLVIVLLWVDIICFMFGMQL